MNLNEILQHLNTINIFIKKYRLRPMWFTFLGTVYAYLIYKGIVENWADINKLFTDYGVKVIISTFELFSFTSLIILGIIHIIKKRFPGVKAVLLSMLCGIIFSIGFPLGMIGDFTWNELPFIYTLLKDICGIITLLLMPEIVWRNFYKLLKRVNQTM